MVFRKPYAFLIKNFKIIHIILSILMILFFMKMRDITDFFKQYINDSLYQQISGVVSEYLGIWAFLLPIAIIVILVVIISLLKMKDKPVKYYWLTILVYVIELVVIIVSSTILNDIQLGRVNENFVQIFKDLIDSLSFVPIPFILVAITRGIGFNVKQFNFKKDLIDLDINEADSEEFEVEVEVDTEDLKAKLNRRLRFIKYVYLENKKAFFALGGVIVLAIFVGIAIFISSIEKIYSENEVFQTQALNLRVDNTYKTKYANDGTVLNKNKFYVIVELSVANKLEQDVKIPYDSIYIRVNDIVKYSPIDEYREEFAEFGPRFLSVDKIKSKEKRKMVLLYEIDSKYEKNTLRLEYLLSRSPNGQDEIYDYLKVNIKPKEFKETTKVSEKKMDENLKFDDSLIAGTELKISEVEFNKRYSYKYKQMIGDVEREFTKVILPTDTNSYKKIIMRLKADLKKNDELNQKIYSKFYEKYATIEYEENGKMVKQKTKIIDLTPNVDEYTYLEVTEDVSTSNKVVLIFNIRGKEYHYILVDKPKEEKEEGK